MEIGRQLIADSRSPGGDPVREGPQPARWQRDRYQFHVGGTYGEALDFCVSCGRELRTLRARRSQMAPYETLCLRTAGCGFGRRGVSHGAIRVARATTSGYRLRHTLMALTVAAWLCPLICSSMHSS